MLLHRVLPIVAAILGIALLVVAVVYWVEPAHSLPSFFPGHDANSDTHHVKHGIAAAVVGVALLAYAWFATGRRPSGQNHAAAAE
jgi:hypothetical protein